MAEVQKLATSDIPIGSPTIDNVADAANVAELGTSPTQERSSNSHPHDSEYDTASDLEGGDTSEAEEGGEEYDEDETDLDDETDEDDDDDEIENEDGTSLNVDGVGSSEKVGETDTQKKVDEDRSNPQYIPKRGTFYEHDDRMADGENDGVLQIGDAPGGIENTPKGTTKTSTQSPSISHASKTMKKFQPASASERWSHDRFDPSEQQPKSDAEIINQYGFNMRKESNPPRARRRRRYARGPNKYDRKWEDESAYIKAPNKERKPPRASDFPALNERSSRKQRGGSRDLEDDKERRDEKENRPERRRNAGTGARKSSVNERLNLNATRSNHTDDRRDREDLRHKITGKSSVQSRLNAGVGRQPAMEFKQKNRNIRPSSSSHQSSNSQNNTRSDERFDKQNQRYSQNQTNYSVSNDEQHYQQKQAIRNSSHIKQTQPPVQGDVYNNNNNTSNNSNNQIPTNVSTKLQRTTWQMSSGMQQQQPPHVGSVQMHALASQNQQQQQLVIGQQQPTANAMIMSTVPPQQQQHQHQQQQQLMQTQPQEQRGPPKRYSSMRRSQHDTQHLPDAHSHQQQQLQQMHMQQPPPPQQASQGPQALIMQDQHSILQANLLQMYHQENLQAQMQALQVSQTAPAPQPKQTAYTSVPPPATQTAQPPPPPVYGPNSANAAYYVADAYGASTGNSQPPPPPPTAAQYAPQPQPAYLAPSQSNAAALAYTTQSQPQAQSSIPAVPPTAVYAAGPQPAANANQNFSNYQNYNTVGGTTYFVPPAPTTSRPVVLPQRRPTNAIPILHPSEKNKQRGVGNEISKEDNSKLVVTTQMDSGENIDHIIDNMFVQRPAFQPPQSSISSISSAPAESSGINAGEMQTPSHSSIDINSSSNAGNPLPDSTSQSINPIASKSVDVVPPTNSNTNPSENSSNNNSITPQE